MGDRLKASFLLCQQLHCALSCPDSMQVVYVVPQPSITEKTKWTGETGHMDRNMIAKHCPKPKKGEV
eukprot:434166-Amphidinium_carterae.1